MTSLQQMYTAALAAAPVRTISPPLYAATHNNTSTKGSRSKARRIKSYRSRLLLVVKASDSSSSLDDAKVGQVTEVNIDTFWPIVKSAGDKPVVLDMYTQWCGPCKVIAPKYQELSEKYEDVVFLKLDCNHENRPLAKELGLKVLPTFKIFKDGKVVKEVTGAKLDNLVDAIENARSD